MPEIVKKKRIFQIAKELNISHLEIMQFLENHGTPADSHMATRHAGAARQKYWSEACFKLVAQVKELAESSGLTPVQIALAWAASRSPVSSVIVGASRPSQLIQNAEAAAIILPGEVLEELDRFTV